MKNAFKMTWGAFALFSMARALSAQTPSPTATPNICPVVIDPGDVIVGDAEHGGEKNEFVFEDAINLRALAYDDTVSPSAIRWSYYIAPDPTYGVIYSLNGAAPLSSPLLSGAVTPLSSAQIQYIGNRDGDPDNVEDFDPFTVTFRNIHLSPPRAAVNVDPGASGVLADQTQAVTLFASDGTTASSFSIVVFTSNNTEDAAGDLLVPVDEFDYTDPGTPIERWLGGVQYGSGSATSGAPNGFCLGAPLLGNNSINWIHIGGREVPGDPASGGMIKLIDGNVWQFRAQIHSDQRTIGSTPLLDVSFDNTVAEFFNGGPSPSDPYPAVTEGPTFSVDHMILDNSGGANCIGCYGGTQGGRDSFQFWIAPAPMQLPQWRGLIDAANSAFDPSTDDSNDLNPNFRILDFDAAGINAQADSGRLCLERVWVSSAPLSALRTNQTSLINRPIVESNWRAFNNSQEGQPGTATINDTTQLAFYKLLNGDGFNSGRTGTVKTLYPYITELIEGAGDFFLGELNLALYPIPWQAHHLYVTEVDIRSAVGGTPDAPDAGTVEGTAPVDVIQISTYPPTTELISMNFVIHGSPDTMHRAGSPRLTATLVDAGLPPEQYYVGITHGQNGTNADVTTPSIVKNGNRFQPTLQFLNSNPAILGAGTDEFAVRGIEAYDLGLFPNP